MPRIARPRQPSRKSVLAALRAERDALYNAGARGVRRRTDAPLLWDLAKLAEGKKGRHVTYLGIRFPIDCGLYRYIRDPDAPSSTLVAVDGPG